MKKTLTLKIIIFLMIGLFMGNVLFINSVDALQIWSNSDFNANVIGGSGSDQHIFETGDLIYVYTYGADINNTHDNLVYRVSRHNPNGDDEIIYEGSNQLSDSDRAQNNPFINFRFEKEGIYFTELAIAGGKNNMTVKYVIPEDEDLDNYDSLKWDSVEEFQEFFDAYNDRKTTINGAGEQGNSKSPEAIGNVKNDDFDNYLEYDDIKITYFENTDMIRNLSIINSDGEKKVLSNEPTSKPKISPEGRFLSYIAPYDYEVIGELYIYDYYENQLETIIENSDLSAEHTIKNFWWFDEDIIIFIEGYAYGSISIGGDLYKVNLKTDEIVKVFSPEEPRRQVKDINLNAEEIIMKIAEFDEDYIDYEVIEKTLEKQKILLDNNEDEYVWDSKGILYDIDVTIHEEYTEDLYKYEGPKPGTERYNYEVGEPFYIYARTRKPDGFMDSDFAIMIYRKIDGEYLRRGLDINRNMLEYHWEHFMMDLAINKPGEYKIEVFLWDYHRGSVNIKVSEGNE